LIVAEGLKGLGPPSEFKRLTLNFSSSHPCWGGCVTRTTVEIWLCKPQHFRRNRHVPRQRRQSRPGWRGQLL